MANTSVLLDLHQEHFDGRVGLSSSAGAMVPVPAAALDAISQEEFLCRTRFARIASDFLRLCVARLTSNARALRLMAREEAVRVEIHDFYHIWLARASDLASHNRRLVRMLGRNVFRTRANYFSRWLKHASLARSRHGNYHHGESSALLKMEIRCVIYAVLRLPPTFGSDMGNRKSSKLDILAPADPLPLAFETHDDTRGLIRGEATLLVGIVRLWSSKIITRRKIAELECREAAKRKLIFMFEGSERARGNFVR